MRRIQAAPLNCEVQACGVNMERLVRLHIEKLPEGVFLATSDDIQGLVAQGRTIQEAIELARDVAKKLLGEQSGQATVKLQIPGDVLDVPVIVSA